MSKAKGDYQSMMEKLIEKMSRTKLASELKVDSKSVKTYLEGGNPTPAVQDRIRETFRKFVTDGTSFSLPQIGVQKDLRDRIIELQEELLALRKEKDQEVLKRVGAAEVGLSELKEIVEVNHGLLRAMAQQLLPGPSFAKLLEGNSLVYRKTKEMNKGK